MFDRSEQQYEDLPGGCAIYTVEPNFNRQSTKLLRDKGQQVWQQRTMTPKQIFAKDIEGIVWADVFVADMDGPDPESGMCWGCGYAYRKRPVVMFRPNFRVDYEIRTDLPEIGSIANQPYNLMLIAADWRTDPAEPGAGARRRRRRGASGRLTRLDGLSAMLGIWVNRQTDGSRSSAGRCRCGG
jgi:Nucleoside 2-deoxyribosyltransferase